MNEKNYECFIKQLKCTGFGDALDEDLPKNIETQNAEFTLNINKEYGADNVSATLHLKNRLNQTGFFSTSMIWN